jgi:hypothetical protein
MIRFFARTAILVLIIALTNGAQASKNKIDLSPSGGDDTAAFQAALDAASFGPTKTIRLAPGTYNISRPLVGLNSDVVIAGSGTGTTTILADGSSNPDGLFELGPGPALAAFPNAFLFYFRESDVDVTGQPLGSRRSLDVVLKDLTLAARGKTQPHFDINVGTFTQRMFSLVWMEGNRPDWTNSYGQTPSDIGMIDADHAQISTIRAQFQNVHFDGRNRGRADGEPGGPFDENPDVRNATGFEGGLTLVSLPPDPLVFYFKPLNAEIDVKDSLFTSFPGQAGIFAPALVGSDDPAWSFDPAAAAGSVTVKNSVFEDTAIPVLLPLMSAMDVTIKDSSATRSSQTAVILTAGSPAGAADAIGYPGGSPSSASIKSSSFEGSLFESILLANEDGSPALLEASVRDNTFLLAPPFGLGITGIGVEDADIKDNSFTGQGYSAVIAAFSSGWKMSNNDFCGLDIVLPSPFAPLPENTENAPIVLFFSTDMRVIESECASFLEFPFEDPSNVIIDDD